MVVYDRKVICIFGNFGCFKNSKVVCVDHDNEGFGIAEIERSYSVRKDIFIVGELTEPSRTSLEAFGLDVHNDLCALAQLSDKHRNAHAGSDRVEVGVAMTHNDYV